MDKGYKSLPIGIVFCLPDGVVLDLELLLPFEPSEHLFAPLPLILEPLVRPHLQFSDLLLQHVNSGEEFNRLKNFTLVQISLNVPVFVVTRLHEISFGSRSAQGARIKCAFPH